MPDGRLFDEDDAGSFAQQLWSVSHPLAKKGSKIKGSVVTVLAFYRLDNYL
jgi:hypothetical protein